MTLEAARSQIVFSVFPALADMRDMVGVKLAIKIMVPRREHLAAVGASVKIPLEHFKNKIPGQLFCLFLALFRLGAWIHSLNP